LAAKACLLSIILWLILGKIYGHPRHPDLSRHAWDAPALSATVSWRDIAARMSDFALPQRSPAERVVAAYVLQGLSNKEACSPMAPPEAGKSPKRSVNFSAR
jgi:hypothetical protein